MVHFRVTNIDYSQVITMDHSTKQQGISREQLDDLEMLVNSLRDGDKSRFRVSGGRPATRREIVRTAWANLAIEEPDLTLAEAQRILGEDGTETP